MIQDAFTHGAYLMRINIFTAPKVVFVLRQCIYMVFHGYIGMADYLLQPDDYLLQIASFLLLCLIEYHSNLLLKDENRVKTVRKITAIQQDRKWLFIAIYP